MDRTRTNDDEPPAAIVGRDKPGSVASTLAHAGGSRAAESLEGCATNG
jgi:hypothetical protein